MNDIFLPPFLDKQPVISQTFDPCELDAGDQYQQRVWELAVVDQDAPALCNQGPPLTVISARPVSNLSSFIRAQPLPSG